MSVEVTVNYVEKLKQKRISGSGKCIACRGTVSTETRCESCCTSVVGRVGKLLKGAMEGREMTEIRLLAIEKDESQKTHVGFMTLNRVMRLVKVLLLLEQHIFSHYYRSLMVVCLSTLFERTVCVIQISQKPRN